MYDKKAAVEAILFANGSPAEPDKIAQAIEMEPSQAEKLILELMDDYEKQERVQVHAALAQVVNALHHLIGLIKGVGPGNTLLLALGVEFLDQVAALVVAVSRGGLPAIIAAGSDLVQVVQLIVHCNVVAVGLQRQVA